MSQLPKILRFTPKSGLPKGAPAIIVLQEWWGINDQIKMHAQKIADSVNAEAVLPDLYRGKLGLNMEEASHLMGNLDFKQAVLDIDAIADMLRKETPNRKIGITGFCMGGALTLAVCALAKVPMTAGVPFYGIPNPQLCDVSDIPSRTPLQCHFGDKDSLAGFSDKEAVNEFEKKLQSCANKKFDVTIYRYPNQGHAFMNDEEWSLKQREHMRFGEFDPEAVKLAWDRTFQFFKKHLFN